MTAVLAERRSVPMAPRAGSPTDLLYPGQQDPVGPPRGGWPEPAPDPVLYVVWVPPGRPGRELAPRKALHIGLRPSLGLHDCDGCRP